MYLAELLMKNEMAELNTEVERTGKHLSDLRSGKFDFYNESAITKLQNKIYHISEDLKDLMLESYLTSLQLLGRDMILFGDKEFHYNSLIMKLDKELNNYRNSLSKYLRLNFGVYN